MTEQINDQISAFIDDELSEEECALLVRRFERDTDACKQAQRYALIGSAVRNELLSPDHAVLRRRIANALDGAPAAAAHPAASPNAAVPQRVPLRWHGRYFRPLAGFGIAATVAIVAIVGLRAVNDGSSGAVAPTTAFNASSVPAPRQWSEPASYTVPPDVSAAPTIAPEQIRLTNYLVHHGEYTSGLSRTSVHSNVVGAAEIVVPAEDLAVPVPRPEEPEPPGQ